MSDYIRFMFNSSFKVATVWGIPIKIHSSLLFFMVFFILVNKVELALIPFIILLEICIFTSIALHELGHSFVALRKGCRVRQITLMFMGGVAQMEEIPRKPKDEFQMAIAGPLVSIFLGLLFLDIRFFILMGSGRVNVVMFYAAEIIYLAGIGNLILAVFNLIPAFPMDGGRVLRAFLTQKKGRLRATFIASRIGQVIAIIFGIIGFTIASTSGAINGWVFVAVAFFIHSATGQEYKMVQMQEHLESAENQPC